VATLLRQPLVKDIEYTIYRARLSVIEAKRLGTPLEKMRPILVELEDRGFYEHSGVSLRAMLAAAYRYVSRRKRSGGSTITQQIARTLFIKRLRSALRRKLVELLLALWFDKQFPKSDIADMYICAVRYEHNVMGIAEALSHFFPGQKLNDISIAQTFFLIERVANVRSKLIVEKVSKNIIHLRSKGLLSAGDVVSVMEIFREQINAGRVIAPISDVTRLEDMCSK
jgi:penicillin-binding protein 1A